MQVTQDKPKDYKQRLLNLGIPPNIIPNNIDYAKAYKTLRPARYLLTPTLIIKDTWQLMLFCSPDDVITSALEKYKNVKDNLENSLIYYASWSGNIIALKWFKDHYPKQLIEKNEGKKGLGSYIAWSGNTEALTWFNDNYPKQLLEIDIDGNGNNASHYAAWSGCVEALNWFKKRYSNQLIGQNNQKTTPCHYAAWSGSVEALNWFKKYYPEELFKADTYGRRPVHYAAWSGNTKALAWFKDNYPKQLIKKDIDDAIVCHYAAWSGCAEALAWFNEHYSEQFLRKDENGLIPYHYAAWSGCAEALHWFNDNYPKQLVGIDDDGATACHYAAQSGCVEALNWFKDNYPERLIEADKDGKDITHYAAFSDSTQQLEIALLLSQHPNQFTFITKIDETLLEDIITTLLRLLKNNYSITKINNLEIIQDQRKEAFEFFLKRNRAIKDAKMSFIPFTQPVSPPFLLPQEITKLVLKHLLPSDVDVNRVYDSLLPNERVIFILRDTLRTSIALGEDIKAFNRLINKIDEIQEPHKEELLRHINLWVEEFETCQKNQFFKPTIPASQLKCISLIKEMLNKEEPYKNSLN